MTVAMGARSDLYCREDETARIASFCERLVAGESGVLSVEGRAGIGKTRLLQETCRRVGEAGVRVLSGSASELERELPYGVMRQLFEPAWNGAGADQRERWSAGAARLGAGLLTDLPPAESGPSPEPSFGALHGIYWLAASISEDCPTLLVIDDIQWADRPSLRSLAYISRRIAGLPLALALARRSGERDDGGHVAAVLQGLEVTTLVPGPLTDDAVHAIAAELLERPLPAGSAEVCLELTGGNPLLLSQMLEAIRAEGIEPTAEALRAIGRLAPASLARAVTLRLGRLPEDARRVATSLAVLGDGVSLAHLAALAERPDDTVLTAAGQLVDIGVFSDTQSLAFAHPLIRSSVYADINPPERALLHHRAARALAEAGDAFAVAPHLLASEAGTDEWVVRTLRDSASEAIARGDPETAVRCLRRALAEPPAAESRPAVLADLGIAEVAAEEHSAAVLNLREALAEELDPGTRRDAAVALASALVITDSTQVAIDLLTGERSRLDGDDALRLEVEETMLGVFDPELAPGALERMMGFAKLPGETSMERYALANACVPLGMLPTSTAADAVAVARRALADGALARDPEVSDIAAGTALYPLCFAGELDLAEREAEHVLEVATSRGSADAFVVARCIRTDVFRLRGRLLDAAAEAELTIEQIHRMPETPTTLRCEGATLCMAIDVELLRGDVERARALIERSCEGRDLDDPQMAPIRQARGQVAFAEGDAEEAREDLEAAGRHLDAGGYEDRTIPWRLELARVHAHIGDRSSAVELADRQLALARTWGAPGTLGIALRVRGLVGPREDAEEALRESASLLDDAGFGAQLAWSQIELGAALRRSGARVESKELLQAGLEGAARCQANALVERAREELAVAGSKPRRLAFSGLESLTASERRVAEMAASGMANKEIAQTLFVTLKTVEAHLSRTYRKLDITSRAQLPEALEQPG